MGKEAYITTYVTSVGLWVLGKFQTRARERFQSLFVIGDKGSVSNNAFIQLTSRKRRMTHVFHIIKIHFYISTDISELYSVYRLFTISCITSRSLKLRFYQAFHFHARSSGLAPIFYQNNTSHVKIPTRRYNPDKADKIFVLFIPYIKQ